MFDSIVGHVTTLSLLREAVQQDATPQAVLFEGPPASGKFSVALELGRVLNCQVRAATDCRCGSCSSHRMLVDPHVLMLGGRDFSAEIGAASAALQRSNTQPARELFVRSLRTLTRRFDDLLWSGAEPRLRRLRVQVADLEDRLELLNTDGAAAAAAKLARAANLEMVSVNAVRAIESWARITTPGIKIIIVEVRRWLPEPASNALLRTVEEPPGRTHFIFTAPSSQVLTPTLLSRLTRYRFGERSAAEHAQVIARVFGEPAADGRSVAEYLVGQGEGSADHDDSPQGAAVRFCDATLTGGGWDGADAPSDREEAFAFLQACSEHLRNLLRSSERRTSVQRIERWYRFIDEAAWRVKVMNMNPEATIADISRSMEAGGEPPVRRI